MPKGKTQINQVRRKDRAVTEEGWIREFLHRAPFGFLATLNDGQPFINSNLFVYDEGKRRIYMHTARLGWTRDNLEGASPVCFSTAEMGRLLPADEALEFSVEYGGVTVFGSGTLVDDPEEAEEALQMLLDKYFPHLKPGPDYRPITAEELERTSVYRVSIESWSAKRKSVEPEFPGAFHYRQEKIVQS
jgi:nitroimidazol reductase NimA-like FMN-containing flavoprotein (pyridoxamine 5'-phosphate oxidase superfamily)